MAEDNPFSDLVPQQRRGEEDNPFSDLTPSGGMTRGEIAADVAKSTGVGTVKGTIGLLGLPEQLADWSARGLSWLTGRDPESFRDKGDARLPSTQEIRGAVERHTGPLYEPKTQLGQYGQTVGEFIPGALMGPSGVARRLAMGALVPGVASEAAGEIAQEYAPSLEPYARIAGSLVGPFRGLPSQATGRPALTS